jgi:hypothetical protein
MFLRNETKGDSIKYLGLDEYVDAVIAMEKKKRRKRTTRKRIDPDFSISCRPSGLRFSPE